MLQNARDRIAEEELVDKVIFLDRDGVINRDSANYIKSWAEFEFLPGSLEALALMHRAGYRLIVITNQSAVGRGYFPLTVLEEMHRRMGAAVAAAGGRIDDIFFCLHRPDENCACRKPRPGLILQAQARHAIDLSQSVMVGDSAKDIQCGQNAGCGATILVLSGNGLDALETLRQQKTPPDQVANDLLHAARLILAGVPSGMEK
jgi:D-glycero-D-manno-heptose 1,7-bisphosphate phosphatase